MKRLLRILVRFYPSDWRARYDREFAALLDEAPLSVRDIWDVFWGALKMQITTSSVTKITLICSLAALLVAAAISLAVPAVYSSESILTFAPADGAVVTEESSRLFLDDLAQSIFTRDYLASVVHDHNLYWRERLHMPLDAVVEKMRSDISIHSLTLATPSDRDSYTLAIRFNYRSPFIAQQVNAELTSRFIERAVTSQVFSHSTFLLHDPPSLARWPAPSRMRLTALALFAVTLGGLSFAVVVRRMYGTEAPHS